MVHLTRVVPPRAATPMMAPIDDMVGKYAYGDVFDPLNLANSGFDLKWLREAEIKHGRVCMLAATGFIFPDAIAKLPNVDPQLTSFAAHDANLGPYGGGMGQILLFIGLLEVLGSVPAINYTMNGGDREPGDFGFDPLGYLDGATKAQIDDLKTKELKNGRLAMLAFSGMVTQAALGHPTFPYV